MSSKFEIYRLMCIGLFLILPSLAQAQYSGDDAYDPFADYSEFEEASEEEADINFFKNGRFLNIGLLGGSRSFTGTYGDVIAPGVNVGLFLSYFFDLRFALQVSYVTGDHSLKVVTTDGDLLGNTSLSTTAFSIKYYLNTQNVTRGLADLNPYLLAGFSKTDRTVTLSGADAFAQDSANGFDVGAGIEIPIMRNSMFVGIQGWYYVVGFSDENTEWVADLPGRTKVPLGVAPSGDVFNVLGIFGVNF